MKKIMKNNGKKGKKNNAQKRYRGGGGVGDGRPYPVLVAAVRQVAHRADVEDAARGRRQRGERVLEHDARDARRVARPRRQVRGDGAAQRPAEHDEAGAVDVGALQREVDRRLHVKVEA